MHFDKFLWIKIKKYLFFPYLWDTIEHNNYRSVINEYKMHLVTKYSKPYINSYTIVSKSKEDKFIKIYNSITWPNFNSILLINSIVYVPKSNDIKNNEKPFFLTYANKYDIYNFTSYGLIKQYN